MGPGPPAIQETFWAVRKLFEHVAAERPAVIVFDDIQWGEPTFLDLLEYLADWIKTAPVLFVCLARPEVRELRPEWMLAKPNATLLALDSSHGQRARRTDSEPGQWRGALARRTNEDRRGGRRESAFRGGDPEDARRRRRSRASGWSLELARDVSDVTIPPTIHALLTARLDRLEAEERAVIERASVVGRLFWWGAVAELSPPKRGQR
jgi:predicted ATPase